MRWIPAAVARFWDRVWNDPDAPGQMFGRTYRRFARVVLTGAGLAGAAVSGYADELRPLLGFPEGLTELVRFLGMSIAGLAGYKSPTRAPKNPQP